MNAANEIEGFLFQGHRCRARVFTRLANFEFVNTGGYYHSLPGDPLRTFIDTAAEVQRAMGFQNEKDHPEVSPCAVRDQLQLWRGGCRGRYDSALQTDLPPGSDQAGYDRQLLAQAGRWRQRQRHAHQCVHQQERQEPVLGPEGRREAEQVWLELCRSHFDARQRHLPDAERQRECVSPARPALRSAEPDQGQRDRPWLDGAHSNWQREEHAHGSSLGCAQMPTPTWSCCRCSRPG